MYHELPAFAYTSREWFELEQELIFSKLWRFAGLVEDITEPGDYISVQAGLNNLFIVMGRDQRLRAFHNICRHRGTQLLRAVGKVQKAITCPYHDWTYDLEGKLQSVPEEQSEFGGVDKSCYGLKPAAIDRWHGMLWVHPNPDAEPITKWFDGVEQYLGPHKMEELVEDDKSKTDTVINANWKIVVENNIDVYHLAHLHSGTLAMYDHAKAEYMFIGPHYVFWEPVAPEYGKDLEKNAAYPLLDEVPRDRAGAWVPMLFPGLGLAESESDWSIFHVIPLGPEQTRVITRTKFKNTSSWQFWNQSWKSSSFWSRQIRPKYEGGKKKDDPMASGDFMAEDVYACEQQQKSLTSPYFSVGPSAKHGESTVISHQKIVRDYIMPEWNKRYGAKKPAGDS